MALTLDTYSEDVPELDRGAAEEIGGLFPPRFGDEPEKGASEAD